MSDKTARDKDDKEKKPGEKPAGKFHYNPGNMAGKTADAGSEDGKPKSEGGALKPTSAPGRGSR